MELLFSTLASKSKYSFSCQLFLFLAQKTEIQNSILIRLTYYFEHLTHSTSLIIRLDARLKEPISSDEVVEVCGSSGSGKTYLCLKMASLALVQKEAAVIYIDTTNYVNEENMRLVLSVSHYKKLFIEQLNLLCRISSKRLREAERLSKPNKPSPG